MPKSDVLQDWIERVNNEGRNLTEWETGFMASITEQWEETQSLSSGQQESLERIYAARTK